MREQVEVGQSGEVARLWASGPRSLRLLEPWEPDAAPQEAATPNEDLGWRPGTATRAPLVTFAELQPEPPPARVVMGELLEAWRCAERQLAVTADGEVEETGIQVQIATLRTLYQELFVLVQRRQPERAELGW
jgi:hypothetical protein